MPRWRIGFRLNQRADRGSDQHKRIRGRKVAAANRDARSANCWLRKFKATELVLDLSKEMMAGHAYAFSGGLIRVDWAAPNRCDRRNCGIPEAQR